MFRNLHRPIRPYRRIETSFRYSSAFGNSRNIPALIAKRPILSHLYRSLDQATLQLRCGVVEVLCGIGGCGAAGS